jgi:hypothetical protein
VAAAVAHDPGTFYSRTTVKPVEPLSHQCLPHISKRSTSRIVPSTKRELDRLSSSLSTVPRIVAATSSGNATMTMATQEIAYRARFMLLPTVPDISEAHRREHDDQGSHEDAGLDHDRHPQAQRRLIDLNAPTRLSR